MQLAKVTGTLVATRKDPQLEGMTFLILQQVDAASGDTGGPALARWSCMPREAPLVRLC